ncbi:unnamed protein product [Aphis gossypii]|uniref:Transmembrane protein n=1 Tax=Aphis gossypii TaxID=80765 RepID=A0A9P0JDE6_APHGO|nr:unnamed protein product [Aphis gossypii]
MNSTTATDAWYTTSPLDDFRSILRMIMDETVQFAVAAATLLGVLWSAVVVTAMLAEGVLNAVIQATTDAACPQPKTCAAVSFLRRPLIRSIMTTCFALGLWLTYFGIVIGPVCLVIGRPSASIVRKLLGAVGAMVFG